MEPICEARFNDYSFGFRPNRAAEHAIAVSDRLMQRSHLHYIIEFDIKGFFDNVNHAKLIRQIWALGIHDKHLIYILRRMLTAPIRLENGKIVTPDKGTPQGGIISPLLANIVLNELDWWVTSQWQDNPVADKYVQSRSKIGTPNKSRGFLAMRGTNLKEMFIVRYADDFRIFCRTLGDARRTKTAITQWLSERLKLEVSQEKTKIVNVKRHYSDFLGFKMKVWPKGKKLIVRSHIADKNLLHKRQKLVAQAKRIARPRKEYGEQGEIRLYNSIVVGMQNYYQVATSIAADCKILNRAVMTVLTNRLSVNGDCRLTRTGRKLTDFERARYGQTGQLRFLRGSNDPIYPIGYTQYKCAIHKKRDVCCYTVEGRKGLHNNLRTNVPLMLALMRQPLYGRSAEYSDNRISHFSAQFGKCAITGQPFQTTEEIHCHHIIPCEQGGGDNYDNLTLVCEPVHRLIHATQRETILKYLSELALNRDQLKKLNVLREKAKLQPIILTKKKH
jgi:group II intron reverse transcriptase/maturase